MSAYVRSTARERAAGDPKRRCQRCGLAFAVQHHRDFVCPPCRRAVDRKITGRRGGAS